MDLLAAYLPPDRWRALQQGLPLPEHTSGAALFADISGFTSLTELLARELGPRGGAEELTQQLNRVYDALIVEVERFGGSVIGFAGDAITCWFEDEDEGRRTNDEGQITAPEHSPEVRTLSSFVFRRSSASLRAVACAFAMQAAMHQFASLTSPGGATVALAMKAAVASGPARRFLVGDPAIQVMDVLAGATLERMAAAEQLAARGEVLVDAQTHGLLAEQVSVGEWREQAGERFAVLLDGRWTMDDGRQTPDPQPEPGRRHRRPTPSLSPDEGTDAPSPNAEAERSVQRSAFSVQRSAFSAWLPPPVYERLRAGHDTFLAELRPAVALFLGFGGIDYEQDPQAGERLDAYVRWVQGVLAHHEAYVLQLTIGDKGCYLYAAFGAPLAHDDDALRAVSAALELQAPPPELAYIGPVRIGLSRGRMRTGAYGSTTRRTYGVLGDDVNLAARLMSKAPPGKTLVSQTVADVVSHVYRLALAGRVPLKGKQESAAVSVVLGRRQQTPGQLGKLFASPLLGREHELMRLETLLDGALGGAGHLLNLEGVAGVGKSHLAAVFAQRAAQRGLRVAVGACQRVSRQRAYTPYSQIFRDLLGLEGAPEDQIAQVEALLSVAHPEWELRLPLLGDLLDLPIADNATTAAFEPKLRQEALLALVVDLLRGWAEVQPVLLLVEDAHWMDEASQALTLALGRVLQQVPLLLLLVSRPALRADQPLLPSLEQLPAATQFVLGDLSQQGVLALVSNRLLGTPDPLAFALIHALAQGNPFFSEELVDALRETGAIERDEAGGWRVAQATFDALRATQSLFYDRAANAWALNPQGQLAAASLRIPDSVHGVVLSRIDRLPEEHKLTLKVASVIGRTFAFVLLQQAHPNQSGEPALLGQMALLEVRDFARLELPAPQLGYMFKHTITQEVAYETLLELQQRALHGVVGAALEAQQPEAVEQLAYHYRRAGLRAKALHYLELAAHKAQREGANETALGYYREALALEERWQWHQGQAEVLHMLGRREEQRAALELLQAAPAAPPFTVAFLWGQYHEALGNYAEARTAVNEALAQAQHSGQLLNEVRCLTQLGLIARRQGDYEQARGAYQQALARFADSTPGSEEAARALAQALNGLGIVQRQQGSFEQARASYERALAVSKGVGDKRGEAESLNGLGVTAYYQRHFAAALAYHHEALEIRRTIGDRTGEGTSLYNLAAIAQEISDDATALDYFRAALAVQQATGNRWEEVNIWNGLGVLYQELGEAGQAQQYLQRGLDLSRAIGDEAGQAYLLSNLGLVLRDNGDLLAAERVLAEGLALARAQEDTYLESSFASYLGMVCLDQQRYDSAIEWARSALALRRALDAPLRTTADLATLAAAQLATGNEAAALEYVQQTLVILRRSGGEGPEFPQRDYFICYQVLLRSGQQELAYEALRAAQQLVLARAEKIRDPDLRRSFLERVPINRRITQATGGGG